jgi:hypothetical protein
MPLTVTTTLTATDGRTFATADQFREAFNPPPRGESSEGIQNITWELTSPTTVVRTINFTSEEGYQAWHDQDPWVDPRVQRTA